MSSDLLPWLWFFDTYIMMPSWSQESAMYTLWLFWAYRRSPIVHAGHYCRWYRMEVFILNAWRPKNSRHFFFDGEKSSHHWHVLIFEARLTRSGIVQRFYSNRELSPKLVEIKLFLVEFSQILYDFEPDMWRGSENQKEIIGGFVKNIKNKL